LAAMNCLVRVVMNGIVGGDVTSTTDGIDDGDDGVVGCYCYFGG